MHHWRARMNARKGPSNPQRSTWIQLLGLISLHSSQYSSRSPLPWVSMGRAVFHSEKKKTWGGTERVRNKIAALICQILEQSTTGVGEMSQNARRSGSDLKIWRWAKGDQGIADECDKISGCSYCGLDARHGFIAASDSELGLTMLQRSPHNWFARLRQQEW